MDLQKPPRGLLELMRLRQGGKQPTQFSDTVVPVLEVGAFYGSDLLLATSGAPTIGALNNLTEDLVFSATLRVHAISGRLIVGAAAVTAGGYIQVGLISDSQLRISLGGVAFGVAAAGSFVEFGCPVPGGPVLPSGWGVYARVTGTAAGADHDLDVTTLVENYTQV